MRIFGSRHVGAALTQNNALRRSSEGMQPALEGMHATRSRDPDADILPPDRRPGFYWARLMGEGGGLTVVQIVDDHTVYLIGAAFNAASWPIEIIEPVKPPTA